MGQRPPEKHPLTRQAFAQVVERHQSPLHTFVYRFTGQVELARDLVQETFVAAWRMAQMRGEPFVGSDDDAIRRWLFHTAYCRAISTLRRQKLIRWEPLTPTVEFEMSTAHQTGLSFEDRIAEAELLHEALAQLSAPDVACLLLRVVQGFSYAEIGLIVDASAETVMKRVSRAKQRLRNAYLSRLPAVQE